VILSLLLSLGTVSATEPVDYQQCVLDRASAIDDGKSAPEHVVQSAEGGCLRERLAYLALIRDCAMGICSDTPLRNEVTEQMAEAAAAMQTRRYVDVVHGLAIAQVAAMRNVITLRKRY
jgi:hypothetical protein